MKENEVKQMVANSKAEASPDDGRCGVGETQFPYTGKCCEAREGTVGMEYSSLCPCCSVLNLPIDSTSLEAVTFFECTRNGYVRRVKGSGLSQ
ncbi:MAG TPA: hypothetical protein VHP54_05110 [Caproiciproducens sp.]|nr:hypothetical protein [Caproiciproducens sp.]